MLARAVAVRLQLRREVHLGLAGEVGRIGRHGQPLRAVAGRTGSGLRAAPRHVRAEAGRGEAGAGQQHGPGADLHGAVYVIR